MWIIALHLICLVTGKYNIRQKVKDGFTEIISIFR